MKKFISGIVFGITIIPILDSVAELVCGSIEALKIKNTKKVVKGNVEIAKMQEGIEENLKQFVWVFKCQAKKITITVNGKKNRFYRATLLLLYIFCLK